MRLFVQQRGHTAAPVPDAETAWILVEDNWNDFSYRTLYDIHRQRDGVSVRFGSIKVLRKGQREGPPPLPFGEVEGAMLPNDYGSLGATLDFYGNVARLQPGEREQLLTGLRDLAIDRVRRDEFSVEPGYATSLFRFLPEPDRFYAEVARTLAEGGLVVGDTFSFAFAPGADAAAIRFAFSGPEGIAPLAGDRLPSSRVIVLVGENGVGKTDLLARLARVAYAPPHERAGLRDDGRFDDAPVFPGLVAVSYSAFDKFEPPSLEGDDPGEVARQLRDGTGRYAYCGVRDIAGVFENPGAPTVLLTPDDMDLLFAHRIERVRSGPRLLMLARALEPVFNEPSFERHLSVGEAELSAEERFDRFLGDNPAGAVKNLSSGHKIVLHLLAGLAVSLNKGGLALIDEPETHLHPPLLAALMTGVRQLLEALQAYAIIATHSPVVVQETLATQVKILSAGVASPMARASTIQTFGENTGTLTREIFGLHPRATDYRTTLERMADDFGSVEAIEARLGQPLSSQAVAHVLAHLRRPGA